MDISNISFPNKSIGITGFSSFADDALLIQNIKTYSVKFYKIYMIEKMDHLFVIAVLIALVIIYYLFGVKQVKDKLKLIKTKNFYL